MNVDNILSILRQHSQKPNKETEEYKYWLNPLSFVDLLLNTNPNQIPIYASLPNTIIYSVLIPLKFLKKINIEEFINWDFMINQSWSISYTIGKTKNSKKITISPPFDNEEPSILLKAEPTTYFRSFPDMNKKSYVEISQKIIHLLNLYYLEEHQAYCRLNENGDIEEIINIYKKRENSGYWEDIVNFQRKLLDYYLFISKSALVRFFDCTKVDTFSGWNNATENNLLLDSQKIYAKYKLQDSASYIRGFQIVNCNSSRKEMLSILTGDPIDKKKYEKFIAHDWKNKKIEELSCDPKKLSNYFQISPLPYEISPVFFKTEVLVKYKNDPEKYTLKERSISCRNSWHLQTYDINPETNQLSTYLKYLSHLPYSEQKYWRCFNEQPKGPISERAIKTDFEGRFDYPPTEISQLKSLLKKFGALYKNIWQYPEDNILDELHVPTTNSKKEWKDAIRILQQIIIEGFSESHLKNTATSVGCPLKKEGGSIKVLEQFLIFKKIEKDGIEKIISPLKELQKTRSKYASHRSSEELSKAIRELEKTYGSLKNYFDSMITKCIEAIEALISITDKINN